MALSMYQASIPVFVRALSNLKHVLQKGEAHANEKGYAPDVLLQARLFPDMLPLVRQVQIATDMCKNGAARLASVDPVPFPDEEKTFAELIARIDRALEVLQGFDAAKIDGSEGRPVSFMTRTNGEMKFDGQGYLLTFVLPNLYFHSSITYALLREAGVPLGKTDFLGQR
jgi:hypothetical protein